MIKLSALLIAVIAKKDVKTLKSIVMIIPFVLLMIAMLKMDVLMNLFLVMIVMLVPEILVIPFRDANTMMSTVFQEVLVKRILVIHKLVVKL